MNTRTANFLVIECPFSPYMRIYRVQSERVHISVVNFIILNAIAFVYTLCCCDIVRARADKFLRVPSDNDNNKPYRLLIAINKKEKCTLCLHYYSHQMALSCECLFFFLASIYSLSLTRSSEKVSYAEKTRSRYCALLAHPNTYMNIVQRNNSCIIFI